MTTIFICGDSGDRDFYFLLKNILTKTYRVTYIEKNAACQWGSGYELIAVESERFQRVELEKPVFLLKKGCVPEFGFPEGATVIACSENEEQVKALKGSGCHAITCGFRKTDTFSYSSLSDDEVVVSLNRELTAFSGKNVQPLELPIEIPKGVDIYSVIAFTALRVMLDDFNSEIGELI